MKADVQKIVDKWLTETEKLEVAVGISELGLVNAKLDAWNKGFLEAAKLWQQGTCNHSNINSEFSQDEHFAVCLDCDLDLTEKMSSELDAKFDWKREELPF